METWPKMLYISIGKQCIRFTNIDVIYHICSEWHGSRLRSVNEFFKISRIIFHGLQITVQLR